jgi:hypothetical protein
VSEANEPKISYSVEQVNIFSVSKSGVKQFLSEKGRNEFNKE